MLDTFRKTFQLVARDRPARWFALVAGAVVTSALEMIGAALVYVLLTLITAPDDATGLPLLAEFRGRVGEVSEPALLLAAAGVLVGFFLLRFALHVAYAYVKHRIAHNAGERLSTTLVTGYLRMPYAFHLQRSSAELLRNAHQTVEQLVQQCFLAVIQVLAELLVVFGLLAVMAVVAPAATGMAVLIVGAAALFLLTIVQPRLKKLGGRAQEMRWRTLASFQQALHGIREMKVFGAEAQFASQHRSQRRQLARALYLRGTAIELPRLVIETTLVIFILLLFSATVATGTATEDLLSTLGLFAYAGLRMQPSLQRLIGSLHNVKFSGPAVDQIHSDLLLIGEYERVPSSTTAIDFVDELRMEGVSFTYDFAGQPAIEGLDLQIRAGEAIGICGPTGGGKTTLTDLLVGILDPTVGRVTVDGRDIRANRAGWFRKVGIVPQVVFLADDTIRRNVALGVADGEIDESAVSRAVQLAQLGEFVASAPAGLDTVVGERGVRISGGQRQRVAIARALYRDPDVLVFDEGTAALDTVTESVVISSIERLRGRHTIILVAHRLSTVKNCDRILYVEDGRVAATGTFEELRAGSSGFRALTGQ